MTSKPNIRIEPIMAPWKDLTLASIAAMPSDRPSPRPAPVEGQPA